MVGHRQKIAIILIFSFIFNLWPILPREAVAVSSPVITAVTPSSGPVGVETAVTITGTGFVAGAAVYFGSVPAAVVVVDSTTKITTKAPAVAAPGYVDIRVENPDGGTYTKINGFKYISSPTVTSAETGGFNSGQHQGSTVGGTAVYITGTGFANGATVLIGGNPATSVTVLDDSRLTARTPAGTEGAKDVTVINADGGSGTLLSTSPATFTYIKSNPVITAVTPSQGSTDGGTLLTIDGAELGSGATVKIGGVYAGNVQSNADHTRLTAVTPPGVVGAQDVVVTNPDGASVTRAGGFTYIITPSISSVTPNYGPVTGGTTVVIRGANFDPAGMDVYIGGQKLDNVTVDSSTQITVVTPTAGNPVGPQPVTVTSRTHPEQTATKENAFTFQETKSAPQFRITDPIVPNTGSTAGGDTITIYGDDFLTGAKVYIDGIPCPGVEVLDTTRIVATTPAGSAGPKAVRVVNPDGGEAVLNDGFTYQIPEKIVLITSVTPNKGTVEGNTLITVTGVNFKKPGTDGNVTTTVELTIGGRPVPSLDVKDDLRTITAYTPVGGALGPQDVILTIRAEDSSVTPHRITIERATLAGGYEYKVPESAPTITKVTNLDTNTNEGPLAGGSKVRIEGSDFRSGASVFFGGKPAANVNVVSAGLIEATTPAMDVPGAVDVTVINADTGQATLKDGFIYRGNTLMITSVTPNRGPVTGGTAITITGANFTADTSVKIGTEQANNVSVSPDGMTITATTPPNTQGVKDITVTNRFGTATLPACFTYLVPGSHPVISTVSPDSGPKAGGTVITITGTDFRSGAAVTVGGKPATVLNMEVDTGTNPVTTIITAVTPPGNAGLCDVAVINSDGGMAVKTQGFRYLSAPTITKVTPAQGTVDGGTDIKISGTDFLPGAVVTIGGVAATNVQVVDNTLIKAKTPAHAAGEVEVTVTNTDAASVTLPKAFIYKVPNTHPVITAVMPSKGPVSGGTEITVTGKEFAGDAMVLIGGEQATDVVWVDSTTLKAKTPPGQVGWQEVTVINAADTGQDTFYDPANGQGFEYRIPVTHPVITGVVPNIGPVNPKPASRVTIYGQDFRSGAEVNFGPNPAAVLAVAPDGTSITVVLPAGSFGPADVTVTNPDTAVAVLKDGFTYKVPDSDPSIIGVSPNTGTTKGGTDITITGTDFRDNAQVIVGGLPATNVQVIDTTTIKAKTPAHAAGQVEVTVVNKDGGSITALNAFTYVLATSDPVITGVTPNQGPSIGGTHITIKGDDFRGTPVVTIGGIPALNVRKIDYKTIEADTPPGAVGPADVTVTNPDTGSFTLKGGFTYLAFQSKPAITKVVPNIGPITGGNTVAIIGSDFRRGDAINPLKVYIGTTRVPDTDIEYVDNTLLRVIMPASPTVGPRDVKVVNPDTAAAVLANGYLYKLPDSVPQITAVSPAQGTTAGGTEITITGGDFRDNARVVIGDTEATGVTVVNANTIRVKTPAHMEGVVSVTVVNTDGGTATLPNCFTYKTPLSEPVITGVSPNEGPVTGGTSITITGNDFRSGAAVYIDGIPATGVNVVNYKTITATTPAGTSSGWKEVTVVNTVNGDVASAVLAKGFRYYSVPVITGISPDRGIETGGTEVTITGTGFEPGVTVTFGGNPGTDVQLIGATTIKVKTPAGKPGAVDVTVKNSDGGSYTSSNGFTYVPSRTAPEAPTGFNAYALGGRTVKLTWSAAQYATYYELYGRESGESDYRYIGQTKDTQYFVTGLDLDTTYYFKVRAGNELGISGFSAADSATTDDNTDADDYDQNIDVNTGRDQINLRGGTLLLNIDSLSYLRDNGYHFHLDKTDYLRADTKVISIAAGVVRNLRYGFTLYMGKVELYLSPAALDVPKLWNLTSSQRNDASVRLTVQPVAAQERERLLATLPGNLQLVSDVYDINLATQIRQEITKVDFADAGSTLKIQPNGTYSSGRLAIYRFNRVTRTWERAGSGLSGDHYSVVAPVIYSGTYAVLAAR